MVPNNNTPIHCVGGTDAAHRCPPLTLPVRGQGRPHPRRPRAAAAKSSFAHAPLARTHRAAAPTRCSPTRSLIAQALAAVVALPLLVLGFAAPALEAQSSRRGPAAGAGETRPLQVVATTGFVADLVAAVGGERVRVTTLMGPGVDPHLYRATAGDVSRLQRADAVFYHGLMLEGRLSDLFARLTRAGRPVFAVTTGLDPAALLADDEKVGHPDPHVWLDAALWAQCVEPVRAALAQLDPAGAELYARRAAEKVAQLQALHEWALARAAELPKERRVLVTSHDAFGYFGRAYGFEVIALQGISTATEAGLAEVARLVDFIRERRLPAVFVESSVSPAALQRIARDAGVRIGGELFSDAMGAPGELRGGHDVGTYEGMFRYNLETILSALHSRP